MKVRDPDAWQAVLARLDEESVKVQRAAQAAQVWASLLEERLDEGQDVSSAAEALLPTLTANYPDAEVREVVKLLGRHWKHGRDLKDWFSARGGVQPNPAA